MADLVVANAYSNDVSVLINNTPTPGKEVFLLSMTPSNAVIEVWKKVGTQEQWR